jgi:hypothetical protein
LPAFTLTRSADRAPGPGGGGFPIAENFPYHRPQESVQP